MLEWLTFAMALFSTVLWVLTLVAGLRIYAANRQEVRAVRQAASAMRLVREAERVTMPGQATPESGLTPSE